MSLDHHLATYGTLAPGRSNYHQLSDLRGEWSIGTVRGKLVDKGWGAALGSEYRRVPVQVETENGLIDAWIYVTADPAR